MESARQKHCERGKCGSIRDGYSASASMTRWSSRRRSGAGFVGQSAQSGNSIANDGRECAAESLSARARSIMAHHKRQMHLAVVWLGTGNHNAGWRMEAAYDSNCNWPIASAGMRIAERGWSNFISLPPFSQTTRPQAARRAGVRVRLSATRSTALIQSLMPAGSSPNATTASAGWPPSRKIRAQACRA